MSNVMIDSFSGTVASLKPKHRTELNVLAVLNKSPRVSTFDMNGHEEGWLRIIISDLIRKGFLIEIDDAYPWHYYVLTESGRAEIGLKS